jgi:biotin transporter BioY
MNTKTAGYLIRRVVMALMGGTGRLAGAIKDRLTQVLTGATLAAGLALVVLAGIVVAAIAIGLVLLFIAFAGARRGLGDAGSRLSGGNSLPQKEVA